MPSQRKVRQVAGFIHRYISPELLKRVPDPRGSRGRRWGSSVPLLSAVLFGLASGCKGFTEVEELTSNLGTGVRRQTGINRRVPDTTLRDYVCKLKPEDVLPLLQVVGYDAWRRKALVQDPRFPFGIVSLDGKYPTVADVTPAEYVQVHHDEAGNPSYGMVRTITAALVTAAGTPVIDAMPVRAETNEQGAFPEAFARLHKTYGKLFQLVMYDAGAASEGNASVVVNAGKDYLFQMADPRWTMYKTAELLMRGKAPADVQEQQISQQKRVVRSLTMLVVKPAHKNVTMWAHCRTVLKVHSETYENGVLTGTLTRYYATSLASDTLDAKQWLELIIRRWGVETVHQVLDTQFQEDKRPWITANGEASLVLMLLRRVVYTLMTLYKAVTQRSDDNRSVPWRVLMEWVRDTLKWPNPQPFEGLRPRQYKEPPAFA